MNNLSIDFVYFSKKMKKELTVEVEVAVSKAIANPDSDWDGQNYTEILSVTTYDEGEVVEVDIPKEIIQAEVKYFLRSAVLELSFEDETGGF